MWHTPKREASLSKTKTALVIVGLGLLLGSTIVWTKLLTENMSTMQIVSSRIVLGALTMFALLALKGELRMPSRALLGGATLLGLFDSAVPYMLMAFGARQIEAGLGSVLMATAPLFTTAFAAVLAREERLSVVRLSALVLGLLGVVIIVAPNAHSVSNGLQLGHAVFLAASVTLGATTVFGRRLLQTSHALEVSAWKLAGASALVVPVMLATDGVPNASALDTEPLLAMLFVGVVSTGFARMAYLWASGVIGSTRISLVAYVMPGAGLLMAGLVLGERPAPAIIAGLALVLVSIAGVMPSAREAPVAVCSHLSSRGRLLKSHGLAWKMKAVGTEPPGSVSNCQSAAELRSTLTVRLFQKQDI